MLNHCAFMGRMTRDPELRQTPAGTSVCSFSLAVERDFSSNDGQRGVDFIDCVAWRGTGEFVSRHFSKGAMICVSGRLQIRDWTDKDGNKRRSAEINVDNAYFTGEKRELPNPRDYAQPEPTPQPGDYVLARPPQYSYDINQLQQAHPQTVRITDDGQYDDGDGEMPF